MSMLLDKLFSAVAIGHLTVDLLNAQRSILLAYLSVPLGLSNTMLATLGTIYIWAASASQPVFGWLTDRIGPRWVATVGILFMGGLFSLAMLLPGWPALICLVLASLGSAAFHPAGTMEASLRGQTRFSGRETTATSWFFLFGQMGHTFGPMVGGPLLDMFGPAGLLLLSVFTLPVGLNTGLQLRNSSAQPAGQAQVNAPGTPRPMPPRATILALATIAALQAWVQQNMVTFVPKYLADMGKEAAVYGVIAGLFMGGSAIGNVTGGNLADRFGRRVVAMTALALASLPLFAIARLGWTPWLYLLVPLSGFFTGSVHSILVVTAQRLLPGGMGLASGLTLGFMFSAGALGTMLCGPLADARGIPPVFLISSGLALAAAALAVNLPKR